MLYINIFHTSYGAQREGYAGDGYYYGAGISFLFSELNGETGEITSEGEDNRDPVADDDTAIGFNAVLGFERDDMFIELQYVYAKSEDMEIGDLVINQELNFGGLYLWAGIRF